MRVLFDAYWWVRGPASNRLVQREIVRHWAELFPDDEVFLAVRSSDARLADAPAGAGVVTTPLWPHGVAAISHYPVLARRVRADVVVAHNFTPWSGASAVFVHDVMFQNEPSWFTRAERLYYSLIPRLIGRADLVVTSSRREAQRIEANNPRARRPVVPIGLAVGTDLQSVDPARPDGVVANAPFVLSVGRLNVRKNLARTFEAALASGSIDADRPLVVVGQPEGVPTTLDPATRRAVDAGAIRLLGHVDDSELAWLYAHADLFVFLSLDEGFGLPPLEALSFRCPVLASDIPVLRETLGDQATFVDPLDVGAVAAAMSELAHDQDRVEDPSLPDWSDVVHRFRSAVVASVSPKLD